jgi:putative cell wall-binding protein
MRGSFQGAILARGTAVLAAILLIILVGSAGPASGAAQIGADERSISGTVTDEAGNPLEGVKVYAVLSAGHAGGSAETATDGTYTISGLVGAQLRVWTLNRSSYVDEWYGPGHLVKAGNPYGVGAELVDLSLGSATSIDIDLLPGCTISGHLFLSHYWTGTSGRIMVYNALGTEAASIRVDPGIFDYESPALPPGIYKVKACGGESWVADEWYNDKPCATYSLGDADPIELTDSDALDIDFQLQATPWVTSVSPATGPTAGGTEVVISGKEFARMSGADAVTFGGVPAPSYTVDSPTQITAITPPHAAGRAFVSVTNIAGSISPFNELPSFTYQSAPCTTLRGTDRYDTAIKISQAMFPGALPAGCGLVLAPGETFPEALCGGPLAAAYGGPVLLTPKAQLNNAVRAEIQRLQPTYVICIGFYDGVKNAVQAALPGATVTAIRGITANQMSYKVALALKAKLGSLSAATAIITRGDKFADAIAVSPLACANKWPILLTGPSATNALSIYAAQALGQCGITKAIKVGTYAKLPAAVMGLANLSGGDRYQTNRNVAEWSMVRGGLSFAHLGLATGEKSPDALAAGPYLALDAGILLLSPMTGLPPVIAAELSANAASIKEVSFIGLVEPVIGQVRSRLP